jgi:hypothetical protein
MLEPTSSLVVLTCTIDEAESSALLASCSTSSESEDSACAVCRIEVLT